MNTVAGVPKHLIAIEHLERAIELYLRGDSYYSALHLGGAAEEILNVYGREVPLSGSESIKPLFDQFKDAVVRLADPATDRERAEIEKWAYDRMTSAKNTVKHKAGHRDRSVNIDAKEEAYEVIDRAISTYFRLYSALGCLICRLLRSSTQVAGASMRRARPNPSFEARPNGVAPGPRDRGAYHRPRGPGAPPSVPPHLKR